MGCGAPDRRAERSGGKIRSAPSVRGRLTASNETAARESRGRLHPGLSREGEKPTMLTKPPLEGPTPPEPLSRGQEDVELHRFARSSDLVCRVNLTNRISIPVPISRCLCLSTCVNVLFLTYLTGSHNISQNGLDNVKNHIFER